MSDLKSFLKRVEMFIDLSDEMLSKVEALSRLEEYKSGETIIERNSSPNNFYFIQDGSVEIITASGSNAQDLTDAVVVTLGSGQSFGEMGLVDSGTRSATVKAETDTKLLAINCADFLALCETDTNLGYKVMRNIAVDLSFKLRYRNLI